MKDEFKGQDTVPSHKWTGPALVNGCIADREFWAYQHSQEVIRVEEDGSLLLQLRLGTGAFSMAKELLRVARQRDELEATLRKLLVALEPVQDFDDPIPGDAFDAMNEAEAALAKLNEDP